MSICKSVNQIKDFSIDRLDLSAFVMLAVCDDSFRLGLFYTGLMGLFFISGIVLIAYIFIRAVGSALDGQRIVIQIDGLFFKQ